MCGIFGALATQHDETFLVPHFETIKHRGPDYSELKKIKDSYYMGFHRLAINGLTPEGNQPMFLQGCYLIANAEIFNYQLLAKQYGFELITGSDCEIIIHLYKKFGFRKALELMDGEFAIVLYDTVKNEWLAARDHLGIRGMYMGREQSGAIYFASESKALTFCDQVQQFPPAHFWNLQEPDAFVRYYEHCYAIHDDSEAAILLNINTLLTEAVQKRLMSERPVGCLLSGGLDSSLVAALAAKEYQKQGHQLETFSIGMPGSPDLAAAQEVAAHIGSKHHHVELAEEDFLAVLEHTIYMFGSFDVTTIRASVGHGLIARYVRDHSDVKVLFSGETADEFGSYLYFQNAPDAEAFQQEAIRLLQDIHYFDMKRGDRSISSAGIEARVPFADKKFIQYYMGIDPKLRMFDDNKMEKYWLRKAFEKDGLLPEAVLWRRKNGFSDSVSHVNRSWSTVIKEYVDKKISDAEFQERASEFRYDAPKTKEAYYYRKIFTQFYGKHQGLTPYQWLPKWCGDIVDPSARVLKMYAAD